MGAVAEPLRGAVFLRRVIQQAHGVGQKDRQEKGISLLDLGEVFLKLLDRAVFRALPDDPVVLLDEAAEFLVDGEVTGILPKGFGKVFRVNSVESDQGGNQRIVFRPVPGEAPSPQQFVHDLKVFFVRMIVFAFNILQKIWIGFTRIA